MKSLAPGGVARRTACAVLAALLGFVAPATASAAQDKATRAASPASTTSASPQPASSAPAATGSAPAATSSAPAATPTPKIDTLKRIRETGTILIGVREASVPFAFMDAEKKPQGYSVDLCQRAADAIKSELKLRTLEIKYVPVSPATRILALLEGKIDLECGSTTNTRDRQKQVAFAYTTFIAGIKLLTLKSSNISGVDDLRGKTVVVTSGTTSEKMLKQLNDERLLKLNIVETRDHNQSFQAVAEGKAIAFPMDDILLYGLISKSKNPDDFAVVGKYLSVEPYAIMMRKDEPQLARVVNRALVELFHSGEIRRYYNKWFATSELTVPLSQYLREAFLVPNTYPAWP